MNTQPVTQAPGTFPMAPALILCALFLVIAAICFLFCNAKKRKTKNIGVVKFPSNERKQDVPSTDQLIDAYCLAAQALEQWEINSVYTEAFQRAVFPLQTCLGLRRCVQLEGKSNAWLCDQLCTLFSNEQARLGLTSNGLRIDKKPIARLDEDELRAKCSALAPAKLQAETAKLEKRLAGKQACALPFGSMVAFVGPNLWRLSVHALDNDGANALETIDSLEKALQHYGCTPRFYDDPAICANEKLRVQFIADSPHCVELPGFYMEHNAEPALIGGCAGTRRHTT